MDVKKQFVNQDLFSSDAYSSEVWLLKHFIISVENLNDYKLTDR